MVRFPTLWIILHALLHLLPGGKQHGTICHLRETVAGCPMRSILRGLQELRNLLPQLPTPQPHCRLLYILYSNRYCVLGATTGFKTKYPHPCKPVFYYRQPLMPKPCSWLVAVVEAVGESEALEKWNCS